MGNKTKGKILRQARKVCQMHAFEVRRLMGIKASYLGDVERGRDLFDSATYERLWAFYEKHEKPPRYEGTHDTIATLKARWDELEKQQG